MWTIKVTYHNDFQKDQHHSAECVLTDRTINNASPQLLAEIVGDCIREVKQGIEDIEA